MFRLGAGQQRTPLPEGLGPRSVLPVFLSRADDDHQSVGEGDSGSYTVVLGSEPAGEVVVAIRSDTPDVTVDDELTFTVSDWNVAQTVTVTAAHDGDTATLTHSVSWNGPWPRR